MNIDKFRGEKIALRKAEKRYFMLDLKAKAKQGDTLSQLGCLLFDHLNAPQVESDQRAIATLERIIDKAGLCTK